MKTTDLNKILALRAALHGCAEASGCEKMTKATLKAFLRANTTLTLLDCGDGFYAAHREAGAKEGVALRADYDALVQPDGSAAHLCGHDGHAAALCGVALMLEGRSVGRNVFLLCQPAEETGVGAEGCLSLFKKESVKEIYGAHNLPGFPLGQVTTRPGTFACASEGLILRLKGKAAHAAYPENGVSPAMAVGGLLCAVPGLAAPSDYRGMTLCTVIGVQMGEKAFGKAASEAELWLTLRGEYNDDFQRLKSRVLATAQTAAAENGLAFSYQAKDGFPATENTPDCAQRVLKACDGVLLAAPMRWSEDFGHYLKRCPGAFFGIGAGEAQAPLHTAGYEYPDALLPLTAEAFWRLVQP